MPAKKKAKAKPTAKKQAPAGKPANAKSTSKGTWPPPGMRTLTPTCAVKGAGEAVKLYEKLFGAKVLDRFDGPDGTLMHAELMIGDSIFMIGEPWSEPNTMALAIFVPDADATWKKAMQAGCSEIFPMADQFYGDRSGRVMDPYGNQWMISTHVEDVAPEEQHRRFARMIKGEPWK